MADFHSAIDKVFQLEGWHMDHEQDPGGETYFGIAKKYWAGHYIMWGGPPSLEQAHQFYKAMFWRPLLLSEITRQLVADEILEQAVHFGVARAVRHAQMMVNTILQREALDEDGKLGLVTLGILNNLSHSDTLRWYKAMNGFQVLWYAYRSDILDEWLAVIEDETSPDEDMSVFFRGWLKRIGFDNGG